MRQEVARNSQPTATQTSTTKPPQHYINTILNGLAAATSQPTSSMHVKGAEFGHTAGVKVTFIQVLQSKPRQLLNLQHVSAESMPSRKKESIPQAPPPRTKQNKTKTTTHIGKPHTQAKKHPLCRIVPIIQDIGYGELVQVPIGWFLMRDTPSLEAAVYPLLRDMETVCRKYGRKLGAGAKRVGRHLLP